MDGELRNVTRSIMFGFVQQFRIEDGSVGVVCCCCCCCGCFFLVNFSSGLKIKLRFSPLLTTTVVCVYTPWLLRRTRSVACFVLQIFVYLLYWGVVAFVTVGDWVCMCLGVIKAFSSLPCTTNSCSSSCNSSKSINLFASLYSLNHLVASAS